jgi:hypothetical protein
MFRKVLSKSQTWCIGTLAFMAFTTGAADATALPLPIGDTVISGTTSALRPELAGTVVEDVLVPYDFLAGTGEHLLGTVQNRVVRSTLDGTFDFYWRIIPEATSTGDIVALRVGGFGLFPLDGDFRLDGVGSVGPHIARNFGDGFVNFLFDGVGPAESSYFFFLDTDATAYASGGYDLLGGLDQSLSPDFTTFAPTAVPEPASMLLLGTGALGLVAKLRRRR